MKATTVHSKQSFFHWVAGWKQSGGFGLTAGFISHLNSSQTIWMKLDLWMRLYAEEGLPTNNENHVKRAQNVWKWFSVKSEVQNIQNR